MHPTKGWRWTTTSLGDGLYNVSGLGMSKQRLSAYEVRHAVLNARRLPPAPIPSIPDPNAEINADPTSDPTSTGPSAANANAVCRNNVCNSKHDA